MSAFVIIFVSAFVVKPLGQHDFIKVDHAFLTTTLTTLRVPGAFVEPRLRH